MLANHFHENVDQTSYRFFVGRDDFEPGDLMVVADLLL